MSVEDKKEAPAQVPDPEPASGAAFGLHGLGEDVVPLNDEPDEQLERERTERIDMLVGRGRRRRLLRPRRLPAHSRKLALIGGSLLALMLLMAAVVLGRRGEAGNEASGAVGATRRAADSAARPRRLAAVGPSQDAHTRRRAALTAKRKGARRRAAHRPSTVRKSQSARGRGGAGDSATSKSAVPAEAESGEAPTSSSGYESDAGAEEAYEPAPAPEAAPSPEEAAASEFNFESQRP